MSHQSHHKQNKGRDQHSKGKTRKSSLSDQTNNEVDQGANRELEQGCESSETQQMLELTQNQIEELRDGLFKISLPILLGTDGDTYKFRLHSGKCLETGLFYIGEMLGYGTFWKLEFMIDCPAEVFFKSICQNADVNWIPFLDYSKELKRTDEFFIVQQRIHGAPGVSDRDVVCIQFPGKIETTYYGLLQSIPDGYYNEATLPNCVRGEYLPQGWSWTPVVEEDGRNRTHSVLIYNFDLKGYLPKFIVNMAATTFLSRHVRAAQQHGLKLAAALSSHSDNK